MTFQEFRQAVREIADGAYTSVKVEVTDHADGTAAIEWSAYTQASGWTQDHCTADAALAELRALLARHVTEATDADVAAIGEVA